MKILIVEDDLYKRNKVIDILKEVNVQYKAEQAINPALRYIFNHHEKIDGIILDLGIPKFENDVGIKNIPLGGLCVPREMLRLGFNIPILINSYDAYTVKYEEHLVDTHNIIGEIAPYMPNFKDTIISFIESIEKGEF